VEHDQVDRLLSQWLRERPDLDVRPMGVIGRISRLARHLDRRLKPVFQRHDLDRGLFDVLATLRRSGAPYRLSPTELFNSVMLSSGAMTSRIDRLEQAGLVARTPDPEDRRGILVELTPRGRELVDRAVEAHIANEWRLIEALTSEEQAELARLLRKLLVSFERDGAG
jgi:DNA-binding MarR family transcriptional regulator